MEEDNDFLKLPVEDRCQHKLWKARVNGYEDLAKLFLQLDEKSPDFLKFSGLMKKIVIDSNAIAQEKGLATVLVFVEHATCAGKVSSDIVSNIVTKCFSSPRSNTRKLALDICLMFIEVEKQDVVQEELKKGLENKSPKVVAACILALRECLNLFGSKVIAVKPLLKVLPKLLEDRDKSVREESKSLCIEVYRWVGDAMKLQLKTLKPLTLTELEKDFQKVSTEKVFPTRYLKSQKEEITKCQEEDDSAEMKNDTNEPTEIDPYDLMIPVDILSNLPKTFYEQCEAKKWQERKDALESLLQLTSNVKLEGGDYGDLIRTLKKLITKDSNVLVVSLATKNLTNLVMGLKKKFLPYASACVPAIFEKFKEKKQSVLQALREAIDALYSISSFENLLEDIQAALDNKNPQVKSEVCSFLTRCFSTCSAAELNKRLLKAFTVCLLKMLNESDSSVRENSAEALGTALKVVGERAMTPYLQEVDAMKLAKIKDFCEKAVVTTKPHVSQVSEKKPSSAPPKVSSTTKIEDPSPPVKTVVAGVKKSASASTVKPKSAAIGRTVKSGPNKKAGGDSASLEFREPELSDEDVLTQLSNILPDDVVNCVSSSNWKDRLAAVEKIYEIIQQSEKGSLPAQALIRLLAKKPGFKENNFQILKLKFDMLSFIAENSQISRCTVECCLSDVVDKIGDVKNGANAAASLSSLSSATSLEFISIEVLNYAFNQKNPKNQAEALVWLSNALKQFGWKIQVKEVIDHLKRALSSTSPGIRTAALSLISTMYIYAGRSLRVFFEDEKPALLQQIDAEFEKVKDLKPPIPENRSHNDENTEIPKLTVNLADSMPQVDITNQITSQLLSDLADKNWHLRSDALLKVSTIISEAKLVSPNLGDLPNALKPRLADTNKKLALQALGICQLLGTSLGNQCTKQIRNFAPAILACLGDNKANVRAVALQCFNCWMDQCPLASLFEGEIMSDILRLENTFLRIELFTWLTEKLPTVSTLPNAELNLCVPILLCCLEDRNSDVRKKAYECLLPFMMHVGFESMARAASKLKPSSKNTVLIQLEKVRQTLPEKPSARSKQSKITIPTSDRSSPPHSNGNEDYGKNKLSRSTSKSKLALKAPAASSKVKKEEEVDTSPILVANNFKDQRLLDEKSLKVLKWNFTNPREEFYVQLKDQMTTANWGKTLISHCFHNDFKFHIKAIDLLISALEIGIEATTANLDLILKWLALRFFDTNPSVLMKSLDYLQVLFQALSTTNYRLLEPEASSFVPYLILKIGDPKDLVRKGVKEIIKLISKTYPSSKLFSYIMQGLSSKNARQRAECLEELGALIELNGLSVCQPSAAVALKEIARQISDRDNSVRNASLNCVVQAYFIEGDKIYKYVGQLSDKDMSLLEERIKRSSKTRSIKPVEPNNENVIIHSTKMSPPSQLPISTIVNDENKLSRTPQPRSYASETFKLYTEDIEQMFREKEPKTLPVYVPVNADDILNLPDIQLPQTRLRPPASALKLLNNSAEATSAVNLVMAQLTAQEIPVAVEAFTQVEEVLRQNDQAVAVMGSRVDQLLVMGSLQYRLAHNKHMADENICKADVIRLYRCVTATLVTLFDNITLSKRASRDVLRDLIPHLLTVMLDTRLDELQEGAQVVKIINILIMRVLQKSNPTHVLSALIKLLHDCVESVNISDRFTDLVMKCLWKMIRIICQTVDELNIDRILLDIHIFMKAFPSSSWKERPDDTPNRTIKTILYKLVEFKDEKIMNNLSLIADKQESDLVNYLSKLISKRKEGNYKPSNRNSSQDDNAAMHNHPHKRRSSPLKLSKSIHDALTEIFKKIGCKEQTQEGLAELYELKRNHPEADIEPYLKTSSDFFQNYIRQGLKKVENERDSVKSSQDAQCGTPMRNEHMSAWNNNSITNQTNIISKSWEERFPPLPPATTDTTPMDFVEYLKNVAACCGMDTSKYDDPAFLAKISGPDEPMNEEEMNVMFQELEQYRHMIAELKNAL